MPLAKKVLFVTENLTWGGSELLWTKTAVELLNFNVTIGVCVHSKFKLPSFIKELEADEKLFVFYNDVERFTIFKKFSNRLLPHKYRFRKKNNRLKFISNFNPDLLIINQGYNFNGVDLMLYAFKNRINYCTISHAINEALWPRIELREKMKIGFKNSLKNYFVSNHNLQVTELQIASKMNNAAIIRNPFNVAYNNCLNYPNNNNFNIACVGRYDFNAKGQDVLLSVLAMKKWKNRNLIVNFYGEGNELDNLKELKDLFQLSNVRIHNYTETIAIWNKNQGLVLASRFEGLPIVIVEAMLCKRFCIVTDVSGNTELIEDNITGFVAAAPMTKYIDEALERAWNERNNWKAMGEKAYESVIKEVSPNPALDFAQILNNLL